MQFASQRHRSRLILLTGLLGLVLAVLSGNAWALEKIPVAASILPLGDFCRNLGGERVDVEVLIPPGASPHIFEPTPAAVARALTARVFVYVGAGLDPWAERLITADSSKSRVTVTAVEGLPLIKEVYARHSHSNSREVHQKPGGHDGPGEPHHEHPQGNPHVWLDPLLAQDICRHIAAGLIKVDPDHRQVYENHLSRYLQALEDLHQEIQTRVAHFQLREFVCFHPAFSYFARRYGLKEVGVIEESPGREPTPHRIRQIVKAIRDYNVRVVFAEPQLSPRVAEVIAQEAGAKVLLLDPLGGNPPYGSSYLGLMRHNLAVLEKGLR